MAKTLSHGIKLPGGQMLEVILSHAKAFLPSPLKRYFTTRYAYIPINKNNPIPSINNITDSYVNHTASTDSGYADTLTI